MPRQEGTTARDPRTHWAEPFDRGCTASGLTNLKLGRLIPAAAGGRGEVHAQTVRNWRLGRTVIPYWAMVGLWRVLNRRAGPVEAARLLGFTPWDS